MYLSFGSVPSLSDCFTNSHWFPDQIPLTLVLETKGEQASLRLTFPMMRPSMVSPSALQLGRLQGSQQMLGTFGHPITQQHLQSTFIPSSSEKSKKARSEGNGLELVRRRRPSDGVRERRRQQENFHSMLTTWICAIN